MSLTMAQPAPFFSTTPTAGQKRRGDPVLDDEHARFTKRFHLLNLSEAPQLQQQQQQQQPPYAYSHHNQQQLSIPVPTSTIHRPTSPSYTSPSSPPPRAVAPFSPSSHFSSSSFPDNNNNNDDGGIMAVDDTPTRIYISDLGAELAEADAPTEPTIHVLPEIERGWRRGRRGSHMPPPPAGWLLHDAGREEEGRGKELVLYDAEGAGRGRGRGARGGEVDVVGRVVEEMKARRRGEWVREQQEEGTARATGGVQWGHGRNGTEPRGGGEVVREEEEEEEQEEQEELVVDAMEIE